MHALLRDAHPACCCTRSQRSDAKSSKSQQHATRATPERKRDGQRAPGDLATAPEDANSRGKHLRMHSLLTERCIRSTVPTHMFHMLGIWNCLITDSLRQSHRRLTRIPRARPASSHYRSSLGKLHYWVSDNSRTASLDHQGSSRSGRDRWSEPSGGSCFCSFPQLPLHPAGRCPRVP